MLKSNSNWTDDHVTKSKFYNAEMSKKSQDDGSRNGMSPIIKKSSNKFQMQISERQVVPGNLAENLEINEEDNLLGNRPKSKAEATKVGFFSNPKSSATIVSKQDQAMGL